MREIFKLSQFTKLRLLIGIVHVAGIYGLVMLWDVRWLLLTAICHFLFLWVGQEMYVHRFLSHRSFEMGVAWQRVCAFLSIFNLFGSPIGIAATHVTHHKHSDAMKDPHPAAHPIQSWLWIYPKFETSSDVTSMKRLMNDEWLRFITKWYLAIYLSVILAIALIDVRIVIYGFFLHVIYAFFSNGLINVICHKYGYRYTDTNDNSRNNLLVNTLLFGSGIALHNTHHANPKDYKLSRAWYEFDFVGALIDVIRTKRKTA